MKFHLLAEMYFDRGNFYDFTSLGEYTSASLSLIFDYKLSLLLFLINSPKYTHKRLSFLAICFVPSIVVLRFKNGQFELVLIFTALVSSSRAGCSWRYI